MVQIREDGTPSPDRPAPAITHMPRHVGIIMDGNGRWAERRQLPRVEGHRVGAESVRDVVRAARQLGLEALTLYAFSSQNWARPPAEVAALMELLREYVVEERPELMDNDIRLRAIGDIDRLPAAVRDPLTALIADSAANQSMTLTLALSYGGRESIVAAVRHALRACAAGQLDPRDLDADRFTALLPTGDLPPLDLLIRTSGERRVSNFMLWELAYAELYFTDTLWPDFRRQHLYRALEDYAERERRFGLTGDQLRSSPPEVA
jgi:undecaprenyl diphosphate synthase